MVLHYNVTGDSRKAMVSAIENELGIKAKYKGMPSAAYEIGDFTVGKHGELEFDDSLETAKVAPIVDACVMATGIRPAEWENNEKGAEEPKEEQEKGAVMEEPIDLTVTIPIDKVSEANLKSLLEAKGDLIKKALGIENLNFLIDGEEVQFPWFKSIKPDEGMAYTKFIAALCEMSIKQKRISAKAKDNDNEKYAFRCFLLRLGFIGDEYKADRKILLSKLEGSSAFKNGQKGGEE